jgi:hypothetical protein
MAKNDIKIKINIDGKDIELTKKQAKELGQNLDKAGKSAASTDRQLKGAARASSNATKNFSKMSQGITGGLVPAYATLAANIFAIGAAFRFLQDAANYRILIEGQMEYATITGDSLQTLTRQLRAATGGQLAFAEAAQSAAIGRAAGLSGQQLNELGKIAKNASIALGRDLTDSFNRLVRGVTKAEPELLDELGIILRLETATSKYAREIGKTANQLNIFEKTQAVANEVLSQGNDKFAEFSTELNEFNKLAVAFDDLVNRIKGSLTGVAEFIAKGLAGNVAALGGAFALLGSGIMRAISPEMPNIDLAKGAKGARKNLQGLLNDEGKAKFGNLETKKEMDSFERSLRAKTTKFSKYEQGRRLESLKSLNVLRAHHAQLEADQAMGFKRMGLRWKAELMLMQAEAGKAFGFIKFAGVMAMRAITAIGYLGLIVSVVGVLAQFIKTTEDPAVAKFREEQERTAEAFKQTAIEIENVTNKLLIADDAFTNLVKRARLMETLDLGNTFNLDNLSDKKTSGTSGKQSSSRIGKNILRAIGSAGMFNFGAGGVNEIEAITKASDFISEGDQGVIEGALAKLEKGIGIVGAKSTQGVQLQSIINDITRERDAGNLEGIRQIFTELQDPDNALMKELQILVDFSKAPQLIKNAGDEFGKGMTSLVSKSTPLTGATTALGTMVDVFEKMGDVTDKFPGLVKGSDVKEGSDAETIRSMLGIQGYEAIEQATKGIANPEDRAAQQRILLIEAFQQKQIEFQALELRMLNSKRDSQTELMGLLHGQSKLAAGQIQKEQKVKDLKEEIAIIEETRRLRADTNQALDATQAAVEESNIKNLEARLRVAKTSASLLAQVEMTFRDSFEQGMATAINNLITGTQNLKDAFLSMTKSILSAMAQVLAQQAAIAIMGAIPFFPGGGLGSRDGGIMKAPGYRSFATGGVADGPDSGYAATLHGTEAVVPLPNGKSIPVEMSGGAGGNNVSVNVNMTTGETSSTGGGEQAYALGRAISTAVQTELEKQQRPGGALSPY